MLVNFVDLLLFYTILWVLVSFVIHSNSKRDVLVQLADMVAGSINRAENKIKPDSYIYKEIIKKHIEDEWHFK